MAVWLCPMAETTQVSRPGLVCATERTEEAIWR